MYVPHCLGSFPQVRIARYAGMAVLAGLMLSANFSMAVNKGADGLGSEELALLSEYEEQYQKLKDFYNNIYLEAVRTQFKSHVTSEKSATEIDAPSESVRLIYRANGGQYYRMDASGPASDKQSLGPTLKVTLVRPEGYLRALRQSEESGFAIHGMSPSFEKGVSRLSSALFHWASYSMYVTPMEWFLIHEPGFLSSYQITRVSADKDGSDELVTVAMNGIGNGEELVGTFVFYRKKMWALKEYSWGPSSQTLEADQYRIRKAQFQYVGAESPIVNRIEYWMENGLGVKTGFETFDIVKADHGPVPLEEFSLAAIGVGDVARQRNNWQMRLLVLLAGVALVALGVILRRRYRARVGML